MSQSRTEQLAPLTGVGFVLLFLAGALLVNKYEYLPPASELQEFFSDNATRLQIAAYIGVVSAAFLIWFAGSVRHSLRPYEGDTGRLSAVAFGGGATSGALVALAFSVLFVGAARGGNEGGISVDAAVVFYDLYGTVVGSALPVAMAVLIGATAVVVFRTRAWPAWLAWVSAVLALGSVSPIAYIFIGIDLLWVLVVSILLYARGRAEVPAPAE
jgi:hypothetical protein